MQAIETDLKVTHCFFTTSFYYFQLIGKNY